MKRSTPQLSRFLGLSCAGWATALALLLLGAGTPRLAAAQSDNFDNQSDSKWSHYTFPVTNGYGAAVYSFMTNPASANNYALRIVAPPVVSDTNNPPILVPRGGEVWVAADAQYGTGNSSNPDWPGFYAAADLVAWNPAWNNSALGVGWFVTQASFAATAAYFSGWGSGLATIGITRLDLSSTANPYSVLGNVQPGTTVLKTNHQYRIAVSSFDGATFLVQLFDRSQTNTPWQSALAVDYTLFTSGYCALMAANSGIVPPLGNNATQGGDATYDNYAAHLVKYDQNPAEIPAKVSDTSPRPGDVANTPFPDVSVSILNLETSVKLDTIKLYTNGVLLTSGVTISNKVVKYIEDAVDLKDGATVTYANTGVLYASGSWQTNTVVFQDSQNTWFTNSWWWQATVYQPRYAANGSLSLRGFDARMVRSSAANIAASDVNLVVNGSFSANVAQFVAWPGYCGGTHGGNGPNPMDIPGWANGDGAITSKGLNGAGTGGDTGSPFAPAASSGTFLFMQGSPDSVSQGLAGLAPHTTYQLNYDVAARADNSSVWQVVVASDYSGAPASTLYDSGAVAGNPSAFQHVVGYFTTPSSLTGTENIQLKHVDGTGDHTIDFANISIAPTNYAPLPNSLASAQAVLNYQYAVDLAASNWVQTVAFGLAGNEYGAVSNFPGLCLMPAGGATPQGNSFALEAFAYLQLPAGTNNFSVYSDDAVGIYTGASLEDDSIVLLETTGSSTAPLAFSWFVAQAGLYPLHIIYEQGGGPAYLVLNSVTAGTTNLVNAAGSSAQAFYPLTCLSSTSIKGPFTMDAVANATNQLTTASTLCEGGAGPASSQTVTGGTLTVPFSSTPKYYRLDGARATKFTGPITKSISGSVTNLIIPYKIY
jgi:hypothetical protein